MNEMLTVRMMNNNSTVFRDCMLHNSLTLRPSGPEVVRSLRSGDAPPGPDPRISKSRRSCPSKRPSLFRVCYKQGHYNAHQDEDGNLSNKLLKWMQGNAKTSVCCTRQTTCGSMHPLLHLLNLNLCPSVPAPALTSSTPLTKENVRRQQSERKDHRPFYETWE